MESSYSGFGNIKLEYPHFEVVSDKLHVSSKYILNFIPTPVGEQKCKVICIAIMLRSYEREITDVDIQENRRQD